MQISKVQIQNFRNFKSLNLNLGDHAVVLGENKVGKTNFLFALRLLLDPTLPDSARRLRFEDFWDGLPRPLTKKDFIQISIELRGFEKSENLLAVLADHLIKPDPMTAKITYRFQSRQDLEREPNSESDFEFLIFGGGRPENAVGYELRRWMPMDLFPALRDAEADLGRWSRSPLRPLLDRAAQTLDPSKVKAIAGEVHKTTSQIAKLPELAEVVTDVNTQLVAMVGNMHAVETALGFSPTEPDRLLRSLQLLIDGGKRGVAEASLGSANVLYLGLKHLEQRYLVEEGERQHTFLAIEEPEAHLHPHLQRSIYRNYLQARADESEQNEPRTIILTTHSPNVASVARLSNIVVLKYGRSENATIGRSLVDLDLEKTEREDLERYIDVNRGELFFAKAVILVEGDAEKFLLPILAKIHDPKLDLDVFGITVCSIGGTNFSPYIKLLGKDGLNIPFVVLTDFDPKNSTTSQEDSDPESGSKKSYGESRIVNQIMNCILSAEDWDAWSFNEILAAAGANGVFMNTFTFEVDLFKGGAHKLFYEAVLELTENKKMLERFKSISTDPLEFDPEQFLKDLDSIGKGRVAQRLAGVIGKKKINVCPPYIVSALKYIRAKLQ